MRVFVDTSALYAVLDADDDHHAAAASEWRRLLGGSSVLVTSNYVLLETTALLQHRIGLEAVRILHHDVCPVLEVEWVDETVHQTGMSSLLIAGRRRLSLVDCTSFALMGKLGIRQAFSFDAHFAEQGFRCLPQS